MSAPTSDLLLRRLTLPRFLYRRARDTIERPQPPHSWGLATSLLQDAVETLLRVVVEQHGIEVDDQVRFPKLVTAVSQRFESVGGHRASLTKLNTTRVAFKHRGQEVAERDVRAFVVNVEAFLTQTCRDAFNVDFVSLSLADSLGHRRTKNWLTKAETAFAAEDYARAVAHAARAMTIYLAHSMEHDPTIDVRTVAQYRGVPEGFNERVQESLLRLRARLDLTTRGVDMAAYDRFRMLTPRTTIRASGRVDQSFAGDRPPPSRDEARFCIDFVVDAALALRDRRIVPASRPARNSKRVRLRSRCDLIAHWETASDWEIAMGEENERELIRVAEPGEEFVLASSRREHRDYVAVLHDGDTAFLRRDCIDEIRAEDPERAH